MKNKRKGFKYWDSDNESIYTPTGNCRQPRKGEFYLDLGTQVIWKAQEDFEHFISPICIKVEDDEE